MKKLIKATMIACAALLSQWAQGAPILIYQFEIRSLSLECPTGSCHSHIGTPNLDGMYISLSGSAIWDRSAHLFIEKTSPGPSLPVINDGVHSTSLYLLRNYPGYVPAHDEVLPPSHNYLVANLELENIGRHLDGLISVFDAYTLFKMWSLASGGWAGEISSDGIEGNGKILFTGEWTRSGRSVPEPDPIAWALLALAAVMLLERRKQKDSRSPARQ